MKVIAFQNKAALACLAAIFSSLSLASAGSTQTVTFTATVPSVLELTTTSNAAGVTIVSGDYATSDAITSEAAAAHDLAIRANRAWVLSAKSAQANFTFTPATAGDTRTKASTDLAVRKTGGTYQSLSTTNFTLASGTAGGVSDTGNSFSLDYRFASNIKLDPPGSYVLDAIYTLTSP